MITEIDSMTPVDATRVRIEWSAPSADAVSWVFVNGELAAGPVLGATVSRFAVVPLAVGDTARIEVHDLTAADGPAASTYAPTNILPILRWARVAAAKRYRVYHRGEDDASEVLIYDRAADSDRERVELRSPVTLDGQGGVWHFFRVESVDVRSHASERLAWPYLVMEPSAPVTLDVTAGSGAGLFDISIGA